MFVQSRPLACAALLAGLAIASQVDAGCFKNPFDYDNGYEQFANDLYKMTPSSERNDIAKAAYTLFFTSGWERKKGRVYGDLLLALGASASRKDVERLCENTVSLRYLAETMAANANLQPKKITEPVRHLNRIIIGQVVGARTVCFAHLASRWPRPWLVFQEWPNSYKDLCELDALPRSLLLDSRLSPKAKEIKELEHLGWSCFLVQGSEEKRLLLPYADLLMAAHIVEPESNKLAKFYQDPRERPVLAPVDHPNLELLDNAYRFRACELLLAAKNNKNW